MWSSRRGSRNIEYIGAAHDDGLKVLQTAARQLLRSSGEVQRLTLSFSAGLLRYPGSGRPGGRYRATVTDRPGHPLLFLDVDGPLLPFGGSPLPGPREIVAVSHLARLRLDTGARLARLPCTLVWATTWLEDANTEIAPPLGLPDLPVVTWPEPTGAHQREDQWLGLC